jgi:branched-chain amino acid transport system permease protein
MGMQFAILAFIVVVIGGMGSVQGSAVASVLVGLSGAFMSYYAPDLSLAVNMLLMVLVLLVKPSGLYGIKR